jgi:hypothetical protein
VPVSHGIGEVIVQTFGYVNCGGDDSNFSATGFGFLGLAHSKFATVSGFSWCKAFQIASVCFGRLHEAVRQVGVRCAVMTCPRMSMPCVSCH